MSSEREGTSNAKHENRHTEGANNESNSSCEPTKEELLFQQVFSIPLILKEILTYLPFGDLLRTSLVNKMWNFFSREILRERNCIAVMMREDCCRDLMIFNVLLESTENIPFNGISLPATCNLDDGEGNIESHECIGHNDLAEFSSNILSKLSIKYLQVCCDDKACVTVDVTSKILQEGAKLLTTFSLESVSATAATLPEFLGLNLTGPWLPNVRVLEIEPNSTLHDYISNTPNSVIDELVQASPNLRALNGYYDVQHLKFLLSKNLIPVLKEFYYRPTFVTVENEEWVEKFVMSKPKLYKLGFSIQSLDVEFEPETSFREGSAAGQERVVRSLRLLLESSENSLVRLEVDQLSLILMISQWKIPVLQKVKYISVLYNPKIDKSCRLPTLLKLDWPRNFPNLNEACIVNHPFPGVSDEDVEFCINESFRTSEQYFQSKTVTKLTLECFTDDEDSVSLENEIFVRCTRLFVKMFPNVKEFRTRYIRQFPLILTELWTAWSDLESFTVTHIQMELPFSNFDPFFTGLSSAENGYLYENTQELDSLEVVPTRPCLLNLPNLKFIRFDFSRHPDPSCQEIRSTPDLVFISRVTGHCAFKRLPNLIVEIRRETCTEGEKCHLALNHLKPFVTLIDRAKL